MTRELVGAGAPTGTPLADLVPVSGTSELAALPDELAGEPEYEPAVVIRCPTNETGDRNNEVTEAVLHPQI